MDWFIIVKHGDYIGFDMTPNLDSALESLKAAEQAGEFMLVPVPEPQYAHADAPYGYYRIPTGQVTSIRLLPGDRLPPCLGFNTKQPGMQ